LPIVAGSGLNPPAVPPSSPFACVYIIGGCNPAVPAYRGFLYTILISTWVQKRCGGKADIIVFIQMAYDSNDKALPDEDVRLMQKLGIRVRYLPPNPDESFHYLILQKLMIVGLTEYSRVIFIDGDVMLRINVDRYFEMSMKGVLKENVVQRGGSSPVNAGFFMLAPEPGGNEAIQKIIQETEERGRKMRYPHWNNTLGWGQVISPDDPWIDGSGRVGTNWTFYGAYSDQGLIYYWIKYVKKSFPVIMGDPIENWGEAGLESKMSLSDFDSLANTSQCSEGMTHVKSNLAEDFIHYFGAEKPWLQEVPSDLNEESSMKTKINFWFWMLMKVNDDLDIGIDFSKWTPIQSPPLGAGPEYPKLT
jgi:hypothetical protein